jgi:aminoglycoside 6'-N-acetyltransferase I
MADITILPFDDLNETQIEQAADVSINALFHVPSAWHDVESATAETAQFVSAEDRVAFAALDGNNLVGWIGALHEYDYAWELHPLVVAPSHQRQGLGTALIKRLEDAARAAGIASIWIGTDDDFGGTNLFGRDLYPDVLANLARLAPTSKGHPYAFYIKCGYMVVGVLPDVDGPGRHDILMAKRIVAAVAD